jgi:hypothetical protein
MVRGRKPQGKRALSNAERQQRWRDREKQNRSGEEWACNLRRRLLNAVDAWADQGPKGSGDLIFDAITNLADLIVLLPNARDTEAKFALRAQYLRGEPLPSFEQSFPPELFERISKKLADD